ncbi:hypothetical protein Acr_26g0009840 [Actinidia rufa]|uniref:Endonuclease/exonuclease/phosphatase domain-containing protein n=1 Tax=Actinidia rufa TaxID=165716 RepID=A0A7J0H4N0_9ERIC|nr:hypothetical protein Acr_26g0009840 [Actinidia rufa]
MVRTKNKRKEGGQGPSSKLEEDPILTTELARSAKDSHEGEALSEDSDQGTEGEPSEKYSDDTSQPLGDGDPASTQCVRQNAQEDSVNPQSKPSAAVGDRNKDNGSQDKKKSYVSLFARNRLPSTGSKLDFFNLEDGPNPNREGRDPTLRLAVGEVPSWLLWGEISSSIEDQDAVLDNGPYMIYGCPLLLKSMDKYFNFGHTKENCKSITKPTNKAAEPNIASSDQGPRGAAGQPSGMVAKGGVQPAIQKEWVPKQPDPSKDNNASAVAISSLTMEIIPVNHEPNKESIPEPNPEPISEIQSLLIELDLNITELIPESNPIPPPEPNREPISKANLEPSSVSPPKQFQETYPMQSPPPQQLGGEIYIELANHIASKEMRKQVNSNQRKNPPVGSLKNGVLKHLKKIRQAAIMGLIETKLSTQSLERLSKNKLCGWKMVDNFNRHPNGRILVIWIEELVALVILETSDQAIHCQATLGRRSLWENLRGFNSIHHHPWILLGDFNNVLSNGERINGMSVTTYEIREFKECCYDLGLSDLRSTGAFFTWTNNSVWCKLDRVMVNNEWTQRGMLAQAQYDPPGKLSDHSPCSVSFMEEDNRGPIPFKFFNMWVKHDNFQAVWQPRRSCSRPQQQLHNNPNDSELQAAIPILRAKALKLAEAEMSFCSQIAKAKFLKNTDKGQTGVCDPDLERIKEISGFPQGSFPFRYLGIPVADSRLTISQYSPLIDRISDSISAWAGAILSYAGRTELIKSVLQGVECYWLSILPIPAGVKSKIVQLCRNFLWSGKCTINKKPLVAWKEVTLPK